MSRIEVFDGEYKFLSNFYPAEVELDGVFYPTLEHAYQAAKTVSAAEREQIRHARTPGQAKRMGQQVTLNPEWDFIKVSVMRSLLAKKFSDHTLKMKLLDTHFTLLVEGNTWGDTFWGVSGGKGENMLGKLLMELRGKVRWAK